MDCGTVAAVVEPIPAAVHSVNCVNGLGRVAKLFCDLREAGIDARPGPEGIELKGDAKALTADLLDRMRADRDGLLELLERFEERRAIAEADGELSPEDAERVALAEVLAPEPVASGDAAPGDGVGDREPVPGCRCPWCGLVELLDDPKGLRCGRCERLPWVVEGRSIIRADYIGDDLEGLDPDDLPTCPKCGRWCDVESVAGAWRCTRCDGGAEEQRRRTLRVLERVAQIDAVKVARLSLPHSTTSNSPGQHRQLVRGQT